MHFRLLLPSIGLAAHTAACQSSNETAANTEMQTPATPAELALEADLLRASVAEGSFNTPNAARVREASSEALVEPFSLPQDGGLAEDVEAFRRRQQQGAFLAGQYVEQGQRLLDIADFQGAAEAFADALDLDPSNEAARTGINRAFELMGTGGANEAGAVIDEDLGLLKVKRAMARMEADQAVARGDSALSEGRYQDAIDSYTKAKTILALNPLISGDSLDLAAVEGKLQGAVQLEQERSSALATEKARRAEELKIQAEQSDRQRLESQLETLYAGADKAYRETDYDRARDLAEQIIVLDPGNEAAMELRDIARDSYHAKRERQLSDDYREQWQRTFDDLATMALPQVNPIEFDRRRWREVSQRGPREFKRLDEAGDAE
ncbi:MAG: hypothetical protein AAF368_11235, partial [Planctomycetota bacterium]